MNTHVVKVLVENDRARKVLVEFDGKLINLTASKEIILSAGKFCQAKNIPDF